MNTMGCDPRPPRGGRPVIFPMPVHASVLRSTPPSRRATGAGRLVAVLHLVAIHAPLAEGNHALACLAELGHVAIHAPLAEGDRCPLENLRCGGVAIHAPLAEGDPATAVSRWGGVVAIHAPLAEGDGQPSP